MQKIWLVILCGIVWSIFVDKVIAQDSLANPTGQGATLTDKTPAAIENNSNNNGTFNGTLTAPSCTSRICLFGLSRVTPQGSEGIVGAIWNLGGSADEERASADKLRVEMENTKNINDYKLQLLEKLGAAIDSGNSIRIRSIAIALAPLEGYKDFREYLKALFNENT